MTLEPQSKKHLKQEPLKDSVPEMSTETSTTRKACVKIVKSIRFQKFRYQNENRPGKKNQNEDFITLQIDNMKGRSVRIVILCTDGVNHEKIHPNGLEGVNCHNGIYECEYYIRKQIELIRIPYIRIWRMKCRQNNSENRSVKEILTARALYLPSPYKERCLSQCSKMTDSACHNFDTNEVCLGVIVMDDLSLGNLNSTLHAVSSVIINASKKTTMEIRKLSKIQVPALTGDRIDIFMTENSPQIEPGDYVIYVTFDSNVPDGPHWQSNKYSPTDGDVLYKKVISYQVPRFELRPNLKSPVTAIIHIECPRKNLHCTFEFQYVGPPKRVVLQPPSCSNTRAVTSQSSVVAKSEESIFKSSVHHVGCGAPASSSSSEVNTLLVCTTEGMITGKMDANSMQPALFQISKCGEQCAISRQRSVEDEEQDDFLTLQVLQYNIT